MIVESLKVTFVNLETGKEHDVITIPFKEPKDHTDIEIQNGVETFREWFRKGESLYVEIDDEQIIFNSLEIGKKGFFKFKLIEKKFLTEDDL